MTWDELGIESYAEYQNTAHWRKLKKKYLKPSASCFICEKHYNLLLHHVRYDHLGEEKLYRDFYIICFQCHTPAHFIHILWIFEIKIGLTYKSLIKRLYYLRFIYCLKNKEFGASVWAFLKWIFI